MNMGKFIYNEHLASGCILCVEETGWSIVISLLDINGQRRGSATIRGEEVDSCIKELITAFGMYQKLKAEVPLSGIYRTTGPMGLAIDISSKATGIYLTDDQCELWKLLASDESQLDQLVADFLWCKNRALSVHEMLNTPYAENSDMDNAIQILKKDYLTKVDNLSNIMSKLTPALPARKTKEIYDYLIYIIGAALVLCVLLLLIIAANDSH